MNNKQWAAGRLEASRFILFSDVVSFKKRVPVLKDFSIGAFQSLVIKEKINK